MTQPKMVSLKLDPLLNQEVDDICGKFSML